MNRGAKLLLFEAIGKSLGDFCSTKYCDECKYRGYRSLSACIINYTLDYLDNRGLLGDEDDGR